MTTNTKHPWWETGIVYQIYPRSFQDSNGDGIGDLKGIQARLPYLEDLGISAIWLSPIYPSPMVDFGYDVSDYTAIHPIFGAMGDFLELLEEVHRRGMKLILDFVPNHTSDQHPPDLNWRNPEVVQTMFNVMRFWLDRGVDGFRVDVIQTEGQPEVHGVIRQMRKIVEEYGDRVLIGEIYEPYDRLVTYYGEHLDECHLPFNFNLIQCPFRAEAIQHSVREYERCLPQGAWPNWVLGNHDRDRIASAQRAGEANARLAQMLLFTLRGAPTMYYGDEIGMPNVEMPPEQYQDPQALNEAGVAVSRDLERTPMQWDDSPYAGFSTVEPWLPVAADYRSRNVKVQNADPHSMLQMVRQLIRIRQTAPALNHGSYLPISVFDDDVMAYLRASGKETILVILNFGKKERVVNLAGNSQKSQTILLSTQLDRSDEVSLNALNIRGHEGLIIRMSWF